MFIAAIVFGGLAIVGGIMQVVGVSFYRRPGVSFWARMPVWRANDYLYPPGVFLVKAGLAIAAISGVVFFCVSGVIIQIHSRPDK